MKFKLLLMSLLTLSLVACGDSSKPTHDYGDKLTVYAVNDVHGALESDGTVMGLNKLETFIKSQPNYIPEMTVKLAAGDMFQGSGISNLTNGAAMVDTMNAMNFDAMTVGNHEFDWGIETLKNNINRADFPFIAYDIFEKATSKPVSWVDPYAIIEKGGYKIGVIGEIGKIETSIASAMIADHYFSPDTAKVNSLAKDLKKNQKCDVVFLLTHNGPSTSYSDLDSNYVAAIFGGHSHELIKNKSYNGIPYIQASQKTKALTKLTYDFRTKRVTFDVISFSASTVASTASDVAVDDAISQHKKVTDPILNEVVGQIEGSFNASNLGTLVTKVMYEYAVSKGVSSEKLIAIHNSGGVRVKSLGTAGQISDVTYGEIYEAFPFDNDVRLVHIQGKFLKSAGTGNYIYGTDKNMAAIDSETVYDVISISFLTENENGNLYNEGGGECLSESVVYCRDLVRDYIKNLGLLRIDDLESKQESDTLVFYAVNDVHGSISADFDNYQLGMSRLNSYIKNDKDYQNEKTVILSGGDMFQGSGLSNLTKGQSMIEVMNAIKFDAMTIGNHEFDWGVDQIIKNKEIAEFPFLAYDICDKATGQPVAWADPSVVLEKGDCKVGIIGEIGQLESSISYKVIKDYIFKPDTDYVNREAKRLKEEQGCAFVALLTHNGPYNSYERLNSSYIDVIFGGHTHQFENQSYNGIPYLEAGSNSRGMSKVVFNLKTRKITKAEVVMFGESDFKIDSDPSVDRIIDKHETETGKILNEKIGRIDGPFMRYYSSSASGSLGTLITKAMYEYAFNLVEPGLTDLVAIYNTGGVRANLNYHDNGEVTYGDIYSVSPFDNELRLVTVKGSALLKALSGNYYYTTMDVSQIDTGADYSVITLDYLSENPQNNLYQPDGGTSLRDEPDYIRNIVADYFRSKATLCIADYPF